MKFAKHQLAVWFLSIILLSGCSGQKNTQRYEIEIENNPTLDFSIPITENQVVTQPIDIAPIILHGGPAVSASYIVDGEVLAVSNTSPFNYVLDPETLSIGDHVLSVLLESSSGQIRKETVEFTIPENFPQPQSENDSQPDSPKIEDTPDNPTEIAPTSTSDADVTPEVQPESESLDGIKNHEIAVLIPEGTFVMGADKSYGHLFWGGEYPPHSVTVSSFMIYAYEVTNAMYAECVSDTVCSAPDLRDSPFLPLNYYTDPKFSQYPAARVTWYQADEYCEWAGGRLPSEAEWEYAARGTESSKFPWGDNEPSGKLANLCDVTCDRDQRMTSFNDGYSTHAPVGQFPAGNSPFGLYDMYGNAWEWVNDWYSSYTNEDLTNPVGPKSGQQKILKGSSWYNTTDGSLASRLPMDPNELLDSASFRCVFPVP